MAGSVWAKSEEDLLRKHYVSENPFVLKEVLCNRSWDAIKIRAQKMGLKFGKEPERNGSLVPLLMDSNSSYKGFGKENPVGLPRG